MSHTVYGTGGYRPNHPSKGRVFEADDATETVTRWDDAGAQLDQRAYTTAEKADKAARAAAETKQTNKRTVEDRARAALTANATFRALQSPTNAQVLAQVRRLTAECSGLIRLMLNELDTIDDTNGT